MNINNNYKTNLTEEKPTRVRYLVLALIFINIVINYMDRSNISVAASHMSKDLKLSTVQMGLIFSAFGWVYAALQIPSGYLVDRFKPRAVYACSLFIWSLATLLQSIVGGFGSLLGLRLSIGCFEAPVMPASNKVASSWFPTNERASAIAIYSSAQFVGLAFVSPLLFILEDKFGWKFLFILTGLVGIAWSIVWYALYRDPSKSKRINNAELNYIKEGGGIVEDEDVDNSTTKEKAQFKFSDLKMMFSNRKLIGIYIGQFTISSTFWFFLTWFPTYLVEYRHLSFIKSGFVSSVPYLAAFCGVLVSGFVSDKLIKKGVSMGVARKTPIIIGLLLTTTIIGANFVDSTPLIVMFMAIAFFGNGLATITWIFVSLLAPKNLVGLAGGVFNCTGALSSIVIPIVIGIIVSGGNFTPAIALIGILALIGALSYIFIVGKIEENN
ncbi:MULTISPECIES: MFS transporter [Clostridium]|jgi:Sugar phosphate permease|uniref:MFS transporter n=3 Tax=Clostridium TaxID=1485 RepID=A0A9Q5GCU8_CLOBE|nr:MULTISPECIES: MFS transporter [Clostridium]AQS07384.1 D-galactonate transporter [Clostridium beijerinckii]MBA2884554.1 ACS family D-galactonate transporter-like MFS transporter [Clostridium beijerinckii]MBA2898076.1 ACS family D-galactonate transporter-like MFS transporter [Clostridium beijerinckii]MBA2909927.1 ACS family D-galactonate transporter-like MFS transporter [Clostridium beijerinckii]MBA9012983.1 ACS family D-galactonate transporter-like MFS transporter [Clostridium beijerinckii]